MPDCLIGILIGLTIYSLVLTIALVYKNNSSYFIVSKLDVILSGHMAWILLLIEIIAIRPIYEIYSKHKGTKKKGYKNKSDRYIEKVVNKIVRNYSRKTYHDNYFDFNRMTGNEYSEYSGWEDLLVNKPINERVNNKFNVIMFHQKEQTVSELYKYFDLVTEEMMIQDNCSEWYISENKNRKLYKLKRF